jgi:hypothetical protein
MRTSFHHQPEAQHPKSPAIYTPAGRLPHLCAISVVSHRSIQHLYSITSSAMASNDGGTSRPSAYRLRALRASGWMTGFTARDDGA